MSTSAATPTISDSITTASSIPLIKTHDGAITELLGNVLSPDWAQLGHLAGMNDVPTHLMRGQALHLCMEDNLVGHDNWKKNNNYAKHLITQNVSDKPIIHIHLPCGLEKFRGH